MQYFFLINTKINYWLKLILFILNIIKNLHSILFKYFFCFYFQMNFDVILKTHIEVLLTIKRHLYCLYIFLLVFIIHQKNWNLVLCFQYYLRNKYYLLILYKFYYFKLKNIIYNYLKMIKCRLMKIDLKIQYFK